MNRSRRAAALICVNAAAQQDGHRWTMPGMVPATRDGESIRMHEQTGDLVVGLLVLVLVALCQIEMAAKITLADMVAVKGTWRPPQHVALTRKFLGGFYGG